MSAITEFERFEELITPNLCLDVKRCEGYHCIQVEPKKNEEYRGAFERIEWIKNQIMNGKFPGLRCEPVFSRNTCYKLRVCIEPPRYHEVLSDEIDRHVERMKR